MPGVETLTLVRVTAGGPSPGRAPTTSPTFSGWSVTELTSVETAGKGGGTRKPMEENSKVVWAEFPLFHTYFLTPSFTYTISVTQSCPR